MVKSKRRPGPGGFSLVEVMIVALLTSLLFLMISGIWTGFGRSLSDSVAQGRVVTEAALAVETLRRDLRGTLPGMETGSLERGRMVGRLVVGGTQLRLCFDGDPADGSANWAAPDVVLVYQVQDGQLVRLDQTAGSSFVVADNVQQFQVTEQAGGVRIELTVGFRDFARTYTIITRDP
jgi:hypothetical protein